MEVISIPNNTTNLSGDDQLEFNRKVKTNLDELALAYLGIDSNLSELEYAVANLQTNSLTVGGIQTVTGAKTFETNDLIAPDVTTNGDFTVKLQSGNAIVASVPTWRDEYPAMVIPASGSAAPDEVGHIIGGVARTLRGFDGANTEERLSGSFEIPHDYMIGQPIEVHIHWRPATTATGTVIWYFDYEYSPPNAAPIAQVTMQVEATLGANRQYYHLLNTFGNMPQPSTQFSIGGKIGFNIRRTPTNDTFSGDALLEQISLHVPCDTNGSRQIYVK